MYQQYFSPNESVLSATALSEYKRPWESNPTERPSTNFISQHRATRKRLGDETVNLMENCCKAFQKKIAKDKRKLEELSLSNIKDTKSAYVSIDKKEKVRSISPTVKETYLAQSPPRMQAL